MDFGWGRRARLQLQGYNYKITITRLQLQGYNYKVTITRLPLQGYNYKVTITRLQLGDQGLGLALEIPPQ